MEATVFLKPNVGSGIPFHPLCSVVRECSPHSSAGYPTRTQEAGVVRAILEAAHHRGVAGHVEF